MLASEQRFVPIVCATFINAVTGSGCLKGRHAKKKKGISLMLWGTSVQKRPLYHVLSATGASNVLFCERVKTPVFMSKGKTWLLFIISTLFIH